MDEDEQVVVNRTNIELGTKGEEVAARHLRNIGYEILEMNWKCSFGEADIIAMKHDTLVFVEVKTRTDTDAGLPEEAVDAIKRSRYERIAACYLTDHTFKDCYVRFDVIGVMMTSEDHGFLRHHVNAFGVGD